MRKLIAACIIIIIVVSVLYASDSRKVSLRLIGELPISPVVKDSPPVWDLTSGDRVNETIRDLEYWLSKGSSRRSYIINAKNYKFEPKTLYYFGAGTKIRQISYLYHSRFYNFFHHRHLDSFLIDKVELEPAATYNKVFVYEADVRVHEFED
jgi:hypothetical protein